MGYIYILDGSKTSGAAAPKDLLTFIPGAGNIVKVVGVKIGSQNANALGPVTFQFGSYSGDVTGSSLTPVPWDQAAPTGAASSGGRPATMTAKGTVTVNGSGFAYQTQWSFQRVSFVDLWFVDTPFVVPAGASPNIWGVRKTIGLDSDIWTFELRVMEG